MISCEKKYTPKSVYFMSELILWQIAVIFKVYSKIYNSINSLKNHCDFTNKFKKILCSSVTGTVTQKEHENKTNYFFFTIKQHVFGATNLQQSRKFYTSAA